MLPDEGRPHPVGQDAYFVVDEVSFESPRRRALEESIVAFKEASRRVKGAEARIRSALLELSGITHFNGEIARLIAGRGFLALPEVSHLGRRVEGYRHLTIPPWRGIFLVSSDGQNVAAIVFSREPHGLEGRLEELAAPYRLKVAASKDPPEGDGNGPEP